MGLNILTSGSFLLIGVFATVVCQANAEPVAVRGVERGQGYIFSHDEHCYLITARHVSGDRPRAQVIAEGAVTGSASLRFPFWAGIDLAVGIVRRGAAERCSGSIDDLLKDKNSIGQSNNASLVLINDEGFVDRLTMSVTETRYLDLDARFADNDAGMSARQGMSGGFLFVNGNPVGMAIETLDGETVRFIRAEEIHQNVARWIGTQKEIKLSSVNAVIDSKTNGLPLVLVAASAPAVGAEYLPENVLTDGASYLFEPRRNAEIVLDVATEERSTLSSVSIRAEPKEGMTVPRRIVIFASPDAEGSRWKTFWSGEMPRDGVLDTGPRAQTWARRLRIVVASVWSNGPVKVDQITAH